MRTSLTLLLASLLAAPVTATAALRVVTTTEGLAALAREVGGDRVAVESLSRGVQDPHFVDANPILAVKLRDADLLVDVGLELEIGWLPPLVNQSRNAAIQPGGPRRGLLPPARRRAGPLEGPAPAPGRAEGLRPPPDPHLLPRLDRAGQRR